MASRARCAFPVLLILTHLALLSSTTVQVPPKHPGTSQTLGRGSKRCGNVGSSPQFGRQTKLQATGLRQLPSPERPGDDSLSSSPSKEPFPDYVLSFGKHAGSPLSKCPRQYVSWMVKAGVYRGREDLKKALEARGFMQDVKVGSGASTPWVREVVGKTTTKGKHEEIKASSAQEDQAALGASVQAFRDLDGPAGKGTAECSRNLFDVMSGSPGAECRGGKHLGGCVHPAGGVPGCTIEEPNICVVEAGFPACKRGEGGGDVVTGQGGKDVCKNGKSLEEDVFVYRTPSPCFGVDCAAPRDREAAGCKEEGFVYRTPSPCFHVAGQEESDERSDWWGHGGQEACGKTGAKTPEFGGGDVQECLAPSDGTQHAYNAARGASDGAFGGVDDAGGVAGGCSAEVSDAAIVVIESDREAEREAAKVGGGDRVLKRRSITEFFHKTSPSRGMTGSYWADPARAVDTPSPHRTAAAFLLRNEISWIQRTLPSGLSAYGALVHRFVRPLPSSSVRYKDRVRKELDLIYTFGYEECFLHVLDILEKAQGMPYLIRGSAAGSLVCYLLGISHIDPVREDMCLARFMNALRNDLPDVDLDFPHRMRDVIFHRIFQDNPSCAARISNHIFFRKRSAKREAARRCRVRCHVPRALSPSAYMDDGPQLESYRNITAGLVGSHRGYSLHCGGVVVLNRPIREAEWLHHPPEFSGKFPAHQVKWDKRDCQRLRMIKIDVLSNRGLSHLWGISSKQVYEYPSTDDRTASLLASTDTLGITFLDSPAMKKALRLLKPRCRRDLAIALAIVRPAAKESRKSARFLEEYVMRKDMLVFDDDAVAFLVDILRCDEAEAERYRKGFAKRDAALIGEVRGKLESSGSTGDEINAAMRTLSSAHLYGFCKSHAMSYAHMAWALAYEKAHNLKKFWEQYIDKVLPDGMNIYQEWVYKRESIMAGVAFEASDQTCIDGLGPAAERQMSVHGFWTGPEFLPGCYVREYEGGRCDFRGVFATGRFYNKSITFVTCGVGNSEFLDVSYEGSCVLEPGCIVQGTGSYKEALGSRWVQADSLKFSKAGHTPSAHGHTQMSQQLSSAGQTA